MSEKIHTTCNKWLEELEEEAKICVSDEINEEAQSNMVSFGFNQELLKELGRESAEEFLTGCADLYQRKSRDLNMIFYAWFEEQAGQIRISAVSQSHGKLPFSCKLNLTDLSQVVNGIYSENSGLYTKGTLDVWCQNI
ncbi:MULTISPECIES: hypothetical protein [Shewanella]|uniref:hypothetical protein n=1 Tax=Shewanella TaxID=22 RepID=UPI001C65D397|nr:MULTISPECIES: hypothetical protein [Shewanella]QYJ93554.1 hypothetical protein K0I31_18560 [Shewanella spartinae]QYK12693.1 hypothetical protein K0I63_18525 [Shewanella rhizosphaerae]